METRVHILIPDGFLSASIFPFSPNSQLGICSDKSIGFPHMTAEEEILQQVLPEECIWIAPIPAHNAISSLADGKANYAAFFDYTQRVKQQDWLHTTGGKVSKDLQATLVEQPSGAFLLRENNCTLLASREHYDRPEYSESNCSSSSTGSINYVIRENRTLQNYREKIAKSSDEEIVEPENLSSRSNQANFPSKTEKSATLKEPQN